MIYAKALVVDDDPMFRAVAEAVLAAHGIASIATADDGEAALREVRAARRPFDLAVVDLNMPNMDGFTLIRELADEGFSGALIVSSGEGRDLIDTAASLAEMHGLAFLGTLKKPLDDAAMRRLLDQAPTRKRRMKEAVASDLIRKVVDERLTTTLYQPKWSLSDGRIGACEALVRIISRDGTLASPVEYVEAAERHGEIHRLTDLVISDVIQDIATWAAFGYHPDVSINVSPLSLTDRTLPDRLEERFKAAGVAPSRITLEVTETRLLEQGVEVLEVLSRCRLKGFRLSIDDFGTGATNLQQLQRFPFTELKIDKSFVLNMHSDQFAKGMVESSVRLAQAAGLHIVAEGVETNDALEILKRAGVDAGQGFLVSKPVPADRLAVLMDVRPRRREDEARRLATAI